MPSLETIQIEASTFVFIGGLPIGWFIDSKPILFAPQTNIADKKLRGGIAVALSIKDISLKSTILCPLGGMSDCHVRRSIFSSEHSGRGMDKSILTVDGRIITSARARDYPWRLGYMIITTFQRDSIQVKVQIKRLDKDIIINNPIVNLNLYTYFTLGESNFITRLPKEKYVVFAKEKTPNITTATNYKVDYPEKKVTLQIQGLEACYLHSNAFSQQGCIQAVTSLAEYFGGENIFRLSVGEILEGGVELKVLKN